MDSALALDLEMDSPIGWMFSNLSSFFLAKPLLGILSAAQSYLAVLILCCLTAGKAPTLLEAIFSFLFGDGNPNRMIDERRWQLIGQDAPQLSGIRRWRSRLCRFWRSR